MGHEQEWAAISSHPGAEDSLKPFTVDGREPLGIQPRQDIGVGRQEGLEMPVRASHPAWIRQRWGTRVGCPGRESRTMPPHRGSAAILEAVRGAPEPVRPRCPERQTGHCVERLPSATVARRVLLRLLGRGSCLCYLSSTAYVLRGLFSSHSQRHGHQAHLECTRALPAQAAGARGRP